MSQKTAFPFDALTHGLMMMRLPGLLFCPRYVVEEQLVAWLVRAARIEGNTRPSHAPSGDHRSLLCAFLR